MNSILTFVKQYVGINGNYDPHFDSQIIACINSVFMAMRQFGIGPEDGFTISGDKETWQDFIGGDADLLSAVPIYVAIRVKIMFDPPSAQSVLQAMKDTVAEFEWRLNAQVDPDDTFD
jgi:hypothetical protein